MIEPFRVLDLFSGIGGFSLGLERTGGFRTVAFCEIEPFPRRVLAKHWPEVPIYDDVRTLTAERLRANGIAVDVICGGFPCQDISFAGKGAGLAGERSGLWSEIARLVGELRPRYVLVENVAALLSRGLGDVLGDLAALGYDAEWHCIPASAVGAPHRRDRIWIVAYAERRGRDRFANGASWHDQDRQAPGWEEGANRSEYSDTNVADADEPRPEGWLRAGLRECAGERAARASGACVAHASRNGRRETHWLEQGETSGGPSRRRFAWSGSELGRQWLAEPDVGRVAHGIPARVDRLRGLGNAVVPQIPELIGRAILAAECRP